MDVLHFIGTPQASQTGTLCVFGDTIPKGYEYATIAPRSTVDVVLVGGAWLRPGSVVCLHGLACAVASWRAWPSFHVPVLVLELWKACETPVPGPRAPYTTQATYTYADAAAADWVERLVLPMAGRRHARISFQLKETSTITNYDYALVGNMYGSVEYADRHRVTANGSTLLVPTAHLVDVGKPEAYVVYVGGWDSEEAFDDLVVYTRKPLAGTVLEGKILAECWGDLGAGR